MDGEWRLRAACRGAKLDIFFPPVGEAVYPAKRVCWSCPVQYECLAEALDGGIRSGVWGGMSERERRRLLRRYPHVRCWRRALGAAAAQLPR